MLRQEHMDLMNTRQVDARAEEETGGRERRGDEECGNEGAREFTLRRGI